MFLHCPDRASSAVINVGGMNNDSSFIDCGESSASNSDRELYGIIKLQNSD